MAFWMDPFIMLACGIAIAAIAKRWLAHNPHFVPLAFGLTMLVTYVIAVGLFVNAAVLEPIWTLLGADTGTEFMINGIVLSIAEPGLVWQELSARGMFLSVLIFVTYPVFLALGIVTGRLVVGRHPKQEGLIGLVRA